jgi:hypothetical protein
MIFLISSFPSDKCKLCNYFKYRRQYSQHQLSHTHWIHSSLAESTKTRPTSRVSPYSSASRPASSRFSTTAPVTVFVFRSFFLQIKIHEEIPFMTHSECVMINDDGIASEFFGLPSCSFLFLYSHHLFPLPSVRPIQHFPIG